MDPRDGQMQGIVKTSDFIFYKEMEGIGGFRSMRRYDLLFDTTSGTPPGNRRLGSMSGGREASKAVRRER